MLEDTNDIGFQAVEVKDGFGVAPGVWFRFLISAASPATATSRARPASSSGRQTPRRWRTRSCACSSTDGDRTDRNKARLKYVIDRLGIEQVLTLVEEKLGRKLDRITADALLPRPAFDRTAHIGVHAQKQDGLHWIGVVLPVGRMTVEQMHGLAAVAHELGRRRYPAHRLAEPADLGRAHRQDRRLRNRGSTALGLSTKASSIRAGLVACTGNAGCKFAASDTKRHAEDIAR